MCRIKLRTTLCIICVLPLISSCSQYSASSYSKKSTSLPSSHSSASYTSRLPQSINTNGEKTVLVDPRVHAWGAYGADGNLVRAGLATAGSGWCPDIGRPCHTRAGTFRIQSLGNADCKSSKYPLPRGGAPMPYCMYFNGHQGLHGSPAGAVVEGNASHGCVRMHVGDAAWLRYNFANVGTRVIVRSY